MTMIYQMSTSSPRARRRQTRVREILEAALSLLVRHGYEGMTIQRLAADLDYTPGALYRYFESKEAIVAALQDQAVRRFGDILTASSTYVRQEVASRRGRTPALVEVLTLIRCYTGLRRVTPAEFMIHSALIGDPRALMSDDVAATASEPMLSLVAVVAAAIDHSQERSALSPGDSQQRALAMLAALQGVLQLEKLERLVPAMLQVGVLAGAVSRDLLVGWGASRRRLASANQLVDELFGDRGVAEVALELSKD